MKPSKGGRKPGTCDYFGEKNPNAKLTRAQVIDIRKSYAMGTGPKVLAEMFETSPSNISNIVARRVWRHI